MVQSPYEWMNIKATDKFLKLKFRMVTAGYSIDSLADLVHMAPSVLSRSLKGERMFRIDECQAIADVLKIPYEEIHIYFFNMKGATAT